MKSKSKIWHVIIPAMTEFRGRSYNSTFEAIVVCNTRDKALELVGYAGISCGIVEEIGSAIAGNENLVVERITTP